MNVSNIITIIEVMVIVFILGINVGLRWERKYPWRR